MQGTPGPATDPQTEPTADPRLPPAHNGVPDGASAAVAQAAAAFAAQAGYDREFALARERRRAAETLARDPAALRVEVAVRLLEGPSLVRKHAQAAATLRQDLAAVEHSARLARLRTQSAVDAETDPATGKKRYGNEQARAAAVEERLAADHEYRVLEAAIADLREDAATADTDVAYERDRLAAARALARLLDPDSAPRGA